MALRAILRYYAILENILDRFSLGSWLRLFIIVAMISASLTVGNAMIIKSSGCCTKSRNVDKCRMSHNCTPQQLI